MSSNTTPLDSPGETATDVQNAQAELASTSGNVTQRASRSTNRNGTVQSSTKRDYEGATPKLGAILALRSENVTKKVNYDRFLEKLQIYIINELKNGDSIIEVTKKPKATIIEKDQKPKELSDEAKQSTVDVEIHKEEIKDYVKDLKLLKANLKKVYGIIYGNCTESVQTMIETDSEYNEKSKKIDHGWLLEKVKTIVSGLESNVPIVPVPSVKPDGPYS